MFAANDGMGMGALEALRQNGLAGKVPVVGIDGIDAAVTAIEAGEFAGTVAWDPLWTGGMGLAIPYAHATGKIDITKEAEGTPRILWHRHHRHQGNGGRLQEQSSQGRLQRPLGQGHRPNPVSQLSLPAVTYSRVPGTRLFFWSP